MSSSVAGVALICLLAAQDARPTLESIARELAAMRAQQDAMQKDIEAIRALLQGALGGRPSGPPTPSMSATLQIGGRPTKGSASARVVLIEFTDYQCPYCASYAATTFPTIDGEYVATGKVRYVLKNLPIEQIHPLAYKAAVAALCAGDQGRYWDMHRRIFAGQKSLSGEQLERDAAAVGADAARFKACLSSGAHDALIRDDMAEAARGNVTGTPVFVLAIAEPGATAVTPRQVLVGAQPYAAFKDAIDRLLAQTK